MVYSKNECVQLTTQSQRTGSIYQKVSQAVCAVDRLFDTEIHVE